MRLRTASPPELPPRSESILKLEKCRLRGNGKARTQRREGILVFIYRDKMVFVFFLKVWEIRGPRY